MDKLQGYIVLGEKARESKDWEYMHRIGKKLLKKLSNIKLDQLSQEDKNYYFLCKIIAYSYMLESFYKMGSKNTNNQDPNQIENCIYWLMYFNDTDDEILLKRKHDLYKILAMVKSRYDMEGISYIDGFPSIYTLIKTAINVAEKIYEMKKNKELYTDDALDLIIEDLNLLIDLYSEPMIFVVDSSVLYDFITGIVKKYTNTEKREEFEAVLHKLEKQFELEYDLNTNPIYDDLLFSDYDSGDVD